MQAHRTIRAIRSIWISGTALFAIVGVVALSGVSGCTTDGPKHQSVVHNLTPEMIGLAKRPVDLQNSTSVTWNADNRMLVDDWSRAALIDRPSRLTPYPMPH